MLEEHTLLTVCILIIGDKIQWQWRFMPLTVVGEEIQFTAHFIAVLPSILI